MENIPEIGEAFLRHGFLLFLAIIVGLGGYLFFIKALGRLAGTSKTEIDDLIVKHCRRPILGLILIVSTYFFIPFVQIPQSALSVLQQSLIILLVLSLSLLVIRLTHVMEVFVLSKYDLSVRDNLKARAIHTQVRILKRIVYVTVFILAFAAILMTFSKVRQIGTSILASAGIVGIIVGFAAQRSIATLLAGIQIAITQPIRLDDVVVIENEWGRIEEITLTYVVVRVWDQRRLVLPITYFLEKPFQNWTRQSAEVLGTVFLYVDYTIPVSAVREELQHILTQTDLWDQRVCTLQVTNATDRSVELRALVSASDSSKAWELRCLVRERLIDFLQNKYPESLPRFRAQVKNDHAES